MNKSRTLLNLHPLSPYTSLPLRPTPDPVLLVEEPEFWSAGIVVVVRVSSGFRFEKRREGDRQTGERRERQREGKEERGEKSVGIRAYVVTEGEMNSRKFSERWDAKSSFPAVFNLAVSILQANELLNSLTSIIY